jgi:hypothetical protein
VIDVAVLDQALNALSDAVERYDCMGWYDENYADAEQLAEAQTVESARASLADAVGKAKARAPSLWIFTQPYSDLEPFTGLVVAASEDAARRQVLDRWRAEGRLRVPPSGNDYAAYMDEGSDWHLRVSGPFSLAAVSREGNPAPPTQKWAAKITRCLGPTVDVRLSMLEFATIEDDAGGMEETRGDHARETDDEEAAEMQTKADAWGSVASKFWNIRKDLDRRARKAGCR